MAARLKQISDALTTMAPPKLNENGIPSFDDLPLRKEDPHHSAWGLYGDKDELGTLNRLTDERVAAAAKNEIQKGIRYVSRGPHSLGREAHNRTDQIFLVSRERIEGVGAAGSPRKLIVHFRKLTTPSASHSTGPSTPRAKSTASSSGNCSTRSSSPSPPGSSTTTCGRSTPSRPASGTACGTLAIRRRPSSTTA